MAHQQAGALLRARSLITGGSRGIGYAIAERSPRSDHRRNARTEEARNRRGRQASAVPADLRVLTRTKRSMNGGALRRLDVLVTMPALALFANVADMGRRSAYRRPSERSFLRRAARQWIASAACRQRLRRRHNARRGRAEPVLRSAHAEVRQDDIRVSHIMPGSVDDGVQCGSTGGRFSLTWGRSLSIC